ncbi:MAG: ABC-F family ATP-binding cassette domain-containing protein [Thermodesulfobacteriota bacterium]|nr:ABC-F family ATP-binding cassette domain-containing protein [Thermodesulfobacteriota bacterium]
MTSLQNISKQYGGEHLFKDISLHIGDGECIALVGSNGTGKTTLMKIIVNQVEPDSGKVAKSRFSTTGYLPQDGVFHKGKALYKEVETVFDDLISLHDRIEEISHEISIHTNSDNQESPQLKELVDELGKVQHILEYREGYNTETKIKQILSGLGFKENDLYRMTEEFSGGWQMRIELAKLLLREPTILLLDEPTNHLDIESLEWLETYLKSYSGSIIVVSHDSRFLDNLAQRVIEISMGKVTEYTGNFFSYMEQKAQRFNILQATYENQKRLIQKTNRFIERFRYKATKAKQVQSRIKMLEKMELIEIERDEKTISFDFPQPPRPGKVVMELDKIAKTYGSNPVFRKLALTIERGDRIAFLGVNGSGKSTLARIIAGSETFQDGKRNPGHNVSISYYAQNVVEELNPDKTVLETVDEIAASRSERDLRTLLGCFLFTGDDIFKPVSVLSGGEKSRLALARMLITPANLLILDEPTNHLDMQSKVILQQSLKNFSGSYIIVSHDRDFLAPLINKVVVLKNGELDLYHGTVDDYLQKYHAERVSSEESEKRKATLQSGKEQKRREAEKRQERYRKLKPLKDALDKIEEEIAIMEEKKGQIEEAFSDRNTYGDEKKIQSLHIEHDKIVSRLDFLYDEWSEIEGKIERTME